MKKSLLRTQMDESAGEALPLPASLRRLYDGVLAFPEAPHGRPHIIGNFVSTMDGVVSFQIPGRSGGGEISGFSTHDQFVMALLRAASDAVIIGSGTLHGDSGHIRVPSFIYPSHKKEFATLRKRLGKSKEPLNVVISGSGAVDLREPTFRHPHLATLIITTDRGRGRLMHDHGNKLSVTQVRSVGNSRVVRPQDAVDILYREFGVRRLLHEGGPTLFGQFLSAHLIDELFLTLAPQIAGRSRSHPRPGFAGEAAFMPETAPWFKLISLKLAGDHLLTRYRTFPHPVRRED